MPLSLFNIDYITGACVDSHAAAFRAIQGYALVSHGRKYVWLGLLRFVAPEARKPELRAFLKTFGSQATTALDLFKGLQEYSAARGNSADREALLRIKERNAGPLVTALGLSISGYSLFSEGSIPRFLAFREGFKKRFPALMPEVPYHAVLVIAADDPATQLSPKQHEITAQLQGLASVQWELGRVNKEDGKVRDHFGYADGISQPTFFAPENGANPIHWKPFASLARVLTREPGTAEADDEFGSLMAYMKIEQNVAAFRSLVSQMANSSKRTEDEVRSWLVGRSVEGVPLMPGGAGDNDFAFDSDTQFHTCPAGAHIRKANPRNQAAETARILRRGVIYGDGDGPKGMLFQSFQSKLEDTFELIMNRWLLNEDFPVNESGADPILGVRGESPLPAGVTSKSPPTIRSIATVKAGEYFYFPSIPKFGRFD